MQKSVAPWVLHQVLGLDGFQKRFDGGVGAIADMLGALLTVQADGEGRVAFPKDALDVARSGLRQLQGAVFSNRGGGLHPRGRWRGTATGATRCGAAPTRR